MFVVGLGSFREFMEVFAVGRKLCSASTKTTDGWMENPRIGSSSAPVAKRRICERVTMPLCPPVITR